MSNTNAGTAPVGIKAVSKSCGCADAAASASRVGAGGTVSVTMHTLPGQLVSHFSKSFYVITDSADPQYRSVRLTLIK